MRTRRRQRATTALVARVRRRQPKRLLGELGRDGRCAALGRERRGVVEHGGDSGVGRVARRARGDARGGAGRRRSARVVGERFVAPSPRSEVENRRQQRMREANRAVLALDHVRGECRRERVRRDTRPLQERLRRRPQRRRERERVARRRGKSREPRADELVERLRNRERLERVDVHVENACQLQRKERVTARPLVDAKQRLAREGPPETVVQQPMERADAERPNRQALDALRIQRLLERRRLRAVDEPPGEQHEHRARSESSQRKRERARRGRVEPLNVVDGKQNRLSLAEQVQHVAYRHGERAVIDRIVWRPPRGAARSRARAASASRTAGRRRRGRPRRGRRAPRERDRARPPPVATRGPAAHASARARHPRATASTCRSPPRPPARARQPHPPPARRRRRPRRGLPPCRRSRTPSSSRDRDRRRAPAQPRTPSSRSTHTRSPDLLACHHRAITRPATGSRSSHRDGLSRGNPTRLITHEECASGPPLDGRNPLNNPFLPRRRCGQRSLHAHRVVAAVDVQRRRR